jgi:hypothetical protein
MLEQSRQMEVLCLIALADRATSNELPHQLGVLRRVGGAQSLERLLDALLANAMGVLQNGCPQL